MQPLKSAPVKKLRALTDRCHLHLRTVEGVLAALRAGRHVDIEVTITPRPREDTVVPLD